MTADTTRLALRIGALLAWTAAGFYVLMVLGVPYEDLGVQRVMFAVAAIAYVVGGALLWRGVDRRLLTIGTVANLAVMVIWALRVATGGAPADAFAIASKVVELVLAVILIALLLGPFRQPAAGDALARSGR